MPGSVNLKELLAGLTLEGQVPDTLPIERVACHSDRVGRNALFVAIPGTRSDGSDFAAAAVKQGATAVLSEKKLMLPNACCLRTEDARLALAVVSAAWYGHPSESLFTVGVTGTNGKTTTTYLLDSILRGASDKRTLMGTIRHIIHGRVVESANTTPESVELQAFLREALDQGAHHAVLEVSSHSLKMKRVHGLRFSAAIFTNLTRDHMDFHPTPEDYRDTKALLFSQGLKKDGTGIINLDDDAGAYFIGHCAGSVLRYSMTDKRAEIYPLSAALDSKGTRLALQTPLGEISFFTRLRGHFNVYNIMSAVGAGIAAGCDKEQIISGVERIHSVDGRFESVEAGQPFSVLVDYAHTPDALENVLNAARKITPNRLISVFGCGGDRDKGKRPMMGRLSEKLADYTVVTSDNPRTEQPDAILRDITVGMRDHNRYEVIPDRAAAIAAAIRLAGDGDTVVIAGKGHENYQIIGTIKHPFDDRKVAADYLRRRNNHGLSGR